MDPTGGSTPLPPSPSPLPSSPYQQTYNPESGLTFTSPPAGAGVPAPTPRKKGPPKAVGVVVFVVVLMVVLIVSGALDGLFGSSAPPSNQPNVTVSSTSASHTCPLSGAPYETYRFTLVNSDTVNAAVTLGFYLNDVQVMSGTYNAPAGTSTPYTVTANLGSCPASGSSYYLSVVSISAL